MIKKFFENKYLPILTIIAVSLITHFIFFGYPSSVVFDEVHIGKYIMWHLQGSYFFDVHPPLGRLIFAFFAYIFNDGNFNVDFNKIGNTLPHWIIMLRLIPTLFGIALPLVCYGISNRLKIDKVLSFIGAIFICFENSLIVQSRFILTDSFILFFGFISIYIYLIYRDNLNSKNNWIILYSSIFFASLTFSIKWIGLSFIGTIFFFEIISYIKFGFKRFTIDSLKFSMISFIIFMSVYMSIFAIHFKVLPKTGDGDPYMSEAFQKTLIGNKNENNSAIIPKDKFISKFAELNAEMISANNRLTQKHDYSSLWYTWPIMKRPIYYWNSGDDKSIINMVGEKSHIYFIGNPFLYWFGALSIIVLIIISLIKYKEIQKNYSTNLILFGYFINFLPFIFIGRVMFLYHYACALVFGILAIIILINKIKGENERKITATLLLIIVTMSYIYFSPLTYGLALNDTQLQNRIWISSWR